MSKVYIGDGVYVDYDGSIILTTKNGIDITNTIHLELEVYQALTLFVSRLLNIGPIEG